MIGKPPLKEREEEREGEREGKGEPDRRPWPAWLAPGTVLPCLGFLYFFLRHRSPAYFAGGALVLAAFLLLLSAWDRAGRWRPGAVALALAAIGLPALGAWQFIHFRDVGDLDHASYSHALWNLRQGSLDFAFHGRNVFGIHSMYALFLWIPVHWLGGDLALKLGNGACLLAAALLAVRGLRGNREAASWGALAILLSPAIASQFLFGFHPEMLGAPALVLALQAYRDRKLARFLACAAFLAYTKETFALAIGGILLLALLERRSWKWVLLPGILVGVQMAAFWFLILPRFAPEGNHLSHFMPSSPGHFLSLWWRPQNLLYVLHVFLPFLPLLLALPRRYLLLPLPLMAFYAGFPDPLFVQIWPNYAFPAALLAAAGLVLEKDALLSRPDSGRILASCATIALLSYPLYREILSIPAADWDRVRKVAAIRDRIPDHASVLVNGGFITRFASRRTVGMWDWRDRGRPLEDFDYIMMDARHRPAWLSDPEDLARNLSLLSSSPAWSREYGPGQDSLFLFRRRPGSPRP